MDDVEYFVSELAEQECCAEDNEHGETGNNSNDLRSLSEIFEIAAFGPRFDVDDAVKNAPEYCAVAGYLVEDIEAFVGVGC